MTAIALRGPRRPPLGACARSRRTIGPRICGQPGFMTAGDGPRPATSTRSASIDRRLEAPHRRGGASPRIVERVAVLGYRATAWLLHQRRGPAAAVIGRVSQLSYLAWPTKRRWSNRNFGHVLGLPPDHPRVRAAAMAAYMGYGRYLVELMRLPSLPPDKVAGLATDTDVEGVRQLWSAPAAG